MEDIHNYRRQLERVVELIKTSQEISEENKNTILKFRDFLFSEGVGIPRIISYLFYSRKYARMLQKPFKEASESDIRAIIAQLNQEDLSENSKKGFKITLKRLYCFIEGKTKREDYPPNVEWISVTIHNNHSKLPEELLTEEEILNIISKCRNLRDKTLMSTLAESGCRISEIALMKIKNVSFEENGARITVAGKTGMRKILIINSAPYIQEWINQHPDNTNPDSYLWVGWDKEPLCYTRIAAILKKSAKDAGIRKRVYPHLFRHSRATLLASIMSDAGLKQYLGWTQGSNMASTYIHMSGTSTDAAILQLNGIKIHKEETKSKLEPKKCLRCRKLNRATNVVCGVCGLPLDQEEAERVLQKDMETQKANQLMEKLMGDPEVLELIKKKLTNP